MVINNASLQLVKLKDGGTSGTITPERIAALIKSRHSERSEESVGCLGDPRRPASLVRPDFLYRDELPANLLIQK